MEVQEAIKLQTLTSCLCFPVHFLSCRDSRDDTSIIMERPYQMHLVSALQKVQSCLQNANMRLDTARGTFERINTHNFIFFVILSCLVSQQAESTNFLSYISR